MKTTILAKGMYCTSCESVIKNAILRTKGVKRAGVDYASEKVEIEFDPKATSLKEIMSAVERAGYEPIETDRSNLKRGFLSRLFGG